MSNPIIKRIKRALKSVPFAGKILVMLHIKFQYYRPKGLYWQYDFRAAKIDKYVNKIKEQIKGKGYKLLIDAEESKQIIQLQNGLKFNWVIKDPKSLLEMPLKGNFEPECTDLLNVYLNPGDIGFDIGANFGWYSCHMGRLVGENGKIYSFEPTDIVDDLIDNVKINGLSDVVSVNRIALSDKIAQEKMYIPKKLGTAGTAFASFKKHEWFGEDYQVMEITTNTVDSFVRANDIKKIDFIKMDIEGAEFKVLKGAAESLARFRPIIMLELQEYHCGFFGYRPDEVVDFLKSFGYSLFEIEESGRKRLRRIVSISNTQNYNYLALIDENVLRGRGVFIDGEK